MGLVFFVLFGLMLVGVPVAFSIMTSGITYLAITDTNIAVLAQRMVYGLNSFTLLAVPLLSWLGT